MPRIGIAGTFGSGVAEWMTRLLLGRFIAEGKIRKHLNPGTAFRLARLQPDDGKTHKIIYVTDRVNGVDFRQLRPILRKCDSLILVCSFDGMWFPSDEVDLWWHYWIGSHCPLQEEKKLFNQWKEVIPEVKKVKPFMLAMNRYERLCQSLAYVSESSITDQFKRQAVSSRCYEVVSEALYLWPTVIIALLLAYHGLSEEDTRFYTILEEARGWQTRKCYGTDGLILCSAVTGQHVDECLYRILRLVEKGHRFHYHGSQNFILVDVKLANEAMP